MATERLMEPRSMVTWITARKIHHLAGVKLVIIAVCVLVTAAVVAVAAVVYLNSKPNEEYNSGDLSNRECFDQFKGIKDDELKRILEKKNPDLQSLDLSCNKLKRITKETFSRFKKLQILNLSFNEIRTIEDDAFKDLQELKRLSLHNNSLTTTMALTNLSKLEYCSLFQNLWAAVPGLNPALQSLAINYYKMTSFKGLENLRDLTLHVNDWEFLFEDNVIPSNNFMVLSNLIEIDLINSDHSNFNHLKWEIFFSELLHGLQNLKKVSVNGVDKTSYMRDKKLEISTTLHLNPNPEKEVVARINIHQ